MGERRSDKRWNTARAWIALIGVTLGSSVAGCTTKAATPPPAVDDTAVRGQRPAPAPPPPAAEAHSGFSTKQKLVMLAGAAALYYMYKKHQHAAAETGADGQYYLSKNGRVYYRDAEHRAHWVTPPPSGIAVPADEAAAYSDFQGYENRPSGRGLEGLSADQPQ